MSYYGDIRLGDTIDIKFTTTDELGAPTTLAGTPAVSAYVGNSTTQITAGITLTVDFDGVTGLHNVRVVASGGNGYATASNYDLIITTGTVDSVSVVGYKIGSFSIEARSAVMPTTAARTLDIASTGEAGLDFANVALPAGSIPALGWIDNGTGQAGATSSTFLFRSAASFADDLIIGATIVLTGGTGAGQARVVSDYVGATDTATVSPDWTTTPDNTTTYFVVPTPPAGTATSVIPAVNVTQLGGDAQSATDLKDFADAGYDPSTNKVQGVVLTDTVTTYTGNTPQTGDSFARLGAPVGASISADVAGVKTQTGAIETDTQDIQTRLPAALNNGVMPADIQRINDVAVTGDGQPGTEFSV